VPIAALTGDHDSQGPLSFDVPNCFPRGRALVWQPVPCVHIVFGRPMTPKARALCDGLDSRVAVYRLSIYYGILPFP